MIYKGVYTKLDKIFQFLILKDFKVRDKTQNFFVI